MEDVTAACELCTICTQPILEATDQEDGHDALLCEGKCNTWYHRWCAGVTKARYEVLSNTEDPFHCPACVAERQENTIRELQDMVLSLAEEVRVLKATVAKHVERRPINPPREPTQQSTQQSSPSRSASDAQWRVMVSKGKGNGKGHGGMGKGKDGVELKGTDKGDNGKAGHPGNNGPKLPRVKINGARKIWGTVRSTTAAAVSKTLKTLTKTATESLTIKRKFKSSPTSPKKVDRWWFVVRGDEQILQQLQDSWSPVQLQTAWKLEPLLEFQKPAAVSPVPTLTQTVSVSPTRPHHDTGTASQPTQPVSQISSSHLSESSPLGSQPPQ